MSTYFLSRRLTQRIPDHRIKVNVFEPGLMPGSGLAHEYTGFMRFAWFKIFPNITTLLRIVFTPNIRKPSESGASLARLAMADDMATVSGRYFEGNEEIRFSTQGYDEKKHGDLW
ncbi:putative Ketoreductase (KR) domain-containing protein [Seiridium cardinale]